MKKRTIIFLAVIIVCSIVSNECSGEETNSNDIINTLQETENIISEESAEPEKEPVVELLDDFVLATGKQLTSLLDTTIWWMQLV